MISFLFLFIIITLSFLLYKNGCKSIYSFSESCSVSINHKYISIFLSKGAGLGMCLFLYWSVYYVPLYMSLQYISVLSLYGFLVFLLLGFMIYIELYGYLGLDKTLELIYWQKSKKNSIVFYLYASFISILSEPEEPLYLENISVLSKGRYFILVFFCLFLVLLYLIGLKNKTVSNFLEFFKFPYLQEEVRKLLDALYYDTIGYYLKILDDMLVTSKTFRIIYFLLMFLIFYVYRFFILLLFVNFCFFHGDLCLLLPWVPLSFLFWLLGFLFYHHNWVIQGNITCLNTLLNVTPITNTSDIDKGKSVLPYEFKLTNEHI